MRIYMVFVLQAPAQVTSAGAKSHPLLVRGTATVPESHIKGEKSHQSTEIPLARRFHYHDVRSRKLPQN